MGGVGVVDSCEWERPARSRSWSDEVVDQVLEHLLASADVLRRFALGQDVCLEIGKSDLARLDAPTELAVPTPVAFLDERCQATVGDDRMCDFQAPGKSIHAADVGMEEVDRFEALPTYLGI